MAEGRLQRRLAAIMVSDVAGYSRLMGADEAGTFNRLHSVRADLFDPLTQKYGGRVFKSMGDGVLAEFGSAIDAVQCAVDIQRQVAERNETLPEPEQIIFRIGVSLGDVIVEGDDLYGNGVNVAARMESLAEPGAICVSGNVYEHLGNSVDVVLEDIGEQSVKNIAEPVRAYRTRVEQVGNAPMQPNKTTASSARAEKPSIAVLPFNNMSGDPEQEYFSDGMSEDLITDLSKLSNLSVVARNSSFSIKGQMPDVREVAKKLSVAFVLEGSVRKMGERLRINAQLIDAKKGNHVWAERYDGNMAEIFEFQDRIRSEIVGALELKLTPADVEQAERRRTENIEAYDLYLRGRTKYFKYSDDDNLEAGRLFEQAIALDPNFAEAYSYLAICYVNAWLFLWSGFDTGLKRASELADLGVSLAPNSSIAHVRRGWVELMLHNHNVAKEEIQTALNLDPENSEIHSYYAETLNYTGEYELAEQHTSLAFSLDPMPPTSYYFIRGRCYYHLSQFDKSEPLLRQSIERAQAYAMPHFFLACLYVETDRCAEAERQIQSVLRSNPRYTIEHANRVFPFLQAKDRRQFLEGLRKAGLPEN